MPDETDPTQGLDPATMLAIKELEALSNRGREAAAASASFSLSSLDLGQLANLKAANRPALLAYLKSVLESIQEERGIALSILNQVKANYHFDAPVTVALISKLLDNTKALQQETVKISKIIADLAVSWEAIDSAPEGDANDGQSLIDMAGDIQPKGFDLNTIREDEIR